MGVAFARLRRSARPLFLTGCRPGLALFSLPLFINLSSGRAGPVRGARAVRAATALPGIAALAVAAPRADRLFRASPPAAVVFVGSLIGGFGVLIVVGLHMPNVVLVGVFYALGIALSQAAFATIFAVTSSVIPYRLRSRGSAPSGCSLPFVGSSGRC